jgi:flagellin
MTRINTNLPSMLGALHMSRNSEALNTALERLATGVRINTAEADPSGVIVTDVLRGELTGISSAIDNAERASNLMATADGSMASIADLLLGLQSIVSEVANSGGMTESEVAAKQIELDNTIQAIDQVVRSATFAGQNLIDGSLAYVTEGVDSNDISDLMIHKAPIGATRGGIAIAMDLQVPAERASLIFPNAALAGPVTVRFGGPEGNDQLEFATGTTSTEIALAINSGTEKTGLIAELVGGNPALGVRIMSSEYGSNAFVHTEIVAGLAADFALQDELGAAATRDTGVDIELTLNGSHVIGDGLNAHYVGASMDMEMHFDATWGAGTLPASTDFEIISGGALFQLGSRISAEQQDSIGIAAMDSTSLGSSALGHLSDLTSGGTMTLGSGRLTEIMRVVGHASRQIARTRARVGAFQNNSLTSALDSLRLVQESISAARSSLYDADYAEETAIVTRQEILLQATQAAMAIALRVPQQVLSLLLD